MHQRKTIFHIHLNRSCVCIFLLFFFLFNFVRCCVFAKWHIWERHDFFSERDAAAAGSSFAGCTDSEHVAAAHISPVHVRSAPCGIEPYLFFVRRSVPPRKLFEINFYRVLFCCCVPFFRNFKLQNRL